MKILKRTAKFLAWFFVGIIALLVLVLIFIQTPIGKKAILRIAENQLNKMINAELKIGKLTGNYFSHLELSDILLQSDKLDTVGFIPDLSLRYKLRPLLDNKIEIEYIRIENPFVFLEEFPDSSWNVMHIMIPTEEKDTASAAFDFLIEIQNLKLNDGKIKILSSNRYLPDELNNLFVDISGNYSTENQNLSLNHFSFVAKNPDLKVEQLKTMLSADENAVKISELLLQTAQNEIDIKAEYAFSEARSSYLKIVTHPVFLDEFSYFLPEKFQLNAHPIIDLHAKLENKLLEADLSIKDNNQSLDANLLARQLIAFFTDSTTQAPVSYKLDLYLKNIDARYWLGDPDMNYFADGNIKAEGEGFDPQSLQTKIKADFGNLQADTYRLNRLNADLDYNAGNLKGFISGSADFGDVRISPHILNILSDNPTYNFSLSTQKLNVAQIMNDTAYISDLNMDAEIKGSGIDLKKINASGEINLKPSELMGIKIDSVYSKINFVSQNILVDTLFVEALAAQINAKGNFHLDGESDLLLKTKIKDLSEIAAFAGIDSLESSLAFSARISGMTDSLNANIALDLGKTKYGDYSLNNLSGNGIAQIFNLGDSLYIDADFMAQDIFVGDFFVDSLGLQAASDSKNIDIALQADNQDISAKLKSLVKLGEIIELALSDLMLDYKSYQWNLASDTARISIAENDYIVKDLKLISTNADSIQTISADGKISRTDEQDFRIRISNISIPNLLTLAEIDQNIEGLFSLRLDLEGSPNNPFASGGFEVKNTSVEGVDIDFFASDLVLMDKKLMLTFNLVPQDSGAINAVGELPMDIQLDSLEFFILPKESDPVSLKLNIDRLPLSIVNTFYPTDDIKGYIKSNVILDGTYGKPELLGNIQLIDGKLLLDKYGIDYKQMLATLNFNTDHVKIDRFFIKTNDGRMTIDGNLNFDSEIYKGIVDKSELTVLFDRFNPIDHRHYNMELSGNIDLKGDKDSIRFDGDIQIPESQFYLPAVMNLLGKQTVSEMPKPLLMQELEKMQDKAINQDSIIYTIEPDSIGKNSNQFAFLDNMQGKIGVKIPRNTWVRNEEMRIELSGDLDLLKHLDFFEIFGTVDVIRGQYNMLGKVFIIQSGTVTFQGGEDINPLLNIDALYSFRDNERAKKEMTVQIRGEAFSPEIKFMLDDAQISEGDALSYILFGSSMDALTSGQKDAFNSDLNASDMAETLAASLISSQLTKLLGKTLNVDYIEFKAGSSFDSASFVVGKYITNKLFVSYEQNIGDLVNDDVARYEMKMEYELFDFLFLQLTSSPITSGFDLIFKFNSKTK